MTDLHPLEIELKLALPPAQAEAFGKLMARRRLAPQRQTLKTRYFDTPDFALSRQGIALRVRRAGRRWLQTLKTEGERHGGLSQRIEYEMAVTTGAPEWSRFPPAARAWVPEALRAQLAPVFETDFSRTAWLIEGRGGSAIEVALDVGVLRVGQASQPICEIELELKAGKPDDLFELAQGWAQRFDCLPLDISKAERGVRLAQGQAAAPVKSMPLALDRAVSVEAGFAAMCQDCLAQFQANLPGVLALHSTPDEIEYVHQARVALRRLRAVLRLYRRVCRVPDALRETLRALLAALGPARDWDVLCTETLPAIASRYPDAAAWQTEMRSLAARRGAARAAMQAELGQLHPGAWLLAFQRWLLRHGWRSQPAGGAVPEARRFVQLSALDGWARQALRRGHRPLVRGARAFADLQAAQRHALRIAVKRQRYAAEFFQSLFDVPPPGHRRRQVRYLRVLCDCQDSLGQANDRRVADGLLRTVCADDGPVVAFALGWLAAQQQADVLSDETIGRLKDLKTYW